MQNPIDLAGLPDEVDLSGLPDETNDKGLPVYRAESEHPLDKALEGMDEKRANFIKNHPIISEFFKGATDIGKGLYNTVNDIGRKGAEALKSGDIHGAFQTVTSPLMGIPDEVNRRLLSGDISLPPEQARTEAGNQLMGLTGLPMDAVREAWQSSNYPRLAGQATSALALLGAGKFLHGKGMPEEVTKPTMADAVSPTFEKPNLPPEFAPIDTPVAEPPKTSVKPLEDLQHELVMNKQDELRGPLPTDNISPENTEAIKDIPKDWEVTKPNGEVIEPPKMKRLYRGEIEGGVQGENAGQYFTDRADSALYYSKHNGGAGKIYYIDLPEDQANSYRTEQTGEGAHLLPPDLAEQARNNVLGASNESIVKPPESLLEAQTQGEQEIPLHETAQMKDAEPIGPSGLAPTLKDVQSNEPPTVVPKPGKADDIGALTAEFTSPNKTLSQHSTTRPIAEMIMTAQDKSQQFVATTLRELSEHVTGLDKGTRKILGKLLDHGTDDAEYNQANGITPDLISRANNIRDVLDRVFDLLPRDEKGEAQYGYLDNYLSHMLRGSEGVKEKMAEIFSNQFGKNSGIYALFKKGELGGEGGDAKIYEKGVNTPESQFLKERRNKMDPNDIEWDVARILPAYIESLSKVLYDKSAIESAKTMLSKVPDGMRKELARWYIQNFSGYDANQNLHRVWNKFADQVGSMSARSVVAFNAGLHTLHLGEIPINILPELGPKYTALGIKEISTRLYSNYKEMARMGMLQSEVKPPTFQTATERFDSISYGMSAIESVVKGIAYNGAKQMYMDQGMPENQAAFMAMRKAKDLTLTVDPARKMKGLSPESSFMGGEVGSKLGMQFKGIPFKIVEQWMDTAQQLKENPLKAQAWQKAALAMFGAGAAYKATEEGAHMFHVNPSSLLKFTALGPMGSTVERVVADLSRGDWKQGLLDTAAFATPGGMAGKKAYQAMNPKSMFDRTRKPARLKFINPS